MANITFITAGDSADFATNQCPLTAGGREQAIRLREIFYPEQPDKQHEKFDLVLVGRTQAARETATILLRKQIPAPTRASLPALAVSDGNIKTKTEADIAALYAQFGNGPLRNWVDNDGEIACFGDWVRSAAATIQQVMVEHSARRALVIGQAVLLAGIAFKWVNTAEAHQILLDTVFAGGEGFRLDSDTGAVALIKR